MSISLSTAAVCFIACHGGPADHFSTFAEDLIKKGYKVEIYATGPALKKFQDRHLEIVKPFSLENISEEAAAVELAQKCGNAKVIVTDVGHVFDVTLQKTLASHAPKALRLAYYDNPEPYVPGGYSSVAAKVMMAAQGVLFANGNLSKTPIYQAPTEEIPLALEKRMGIGYYPVNQAEKIAKRRAVDQAQIRAQLFAKHSLVDRGQKVLVYAGGNNDEYFSKALPAFLRFIEEASQLQDLSNVVVLLQQHPGAKEKNLDVNLVKQWMGQHIQGGIPQILISEMSSDEAQVVADAMLYYQTSMGPQFVLAGIPTMQVGHNTYEDILVRNRLCPSVTDSVGFVNAFTHLQERVGVDSGHEAIYQGLGITSHWAKQLEDAINHFKPVDEIAHEEEVARQPAKKERTSMRSYLLGASIALAVGYCAIRLFKRIGAAKA